MTPKQISKIAMLAHEINRAYCQAIGDNSQPSWFVAPEWQKESAIKGVQFHLESPQTPEASHQEWLDFKEIDGWVWGEVKDAQKKTHPCIMPYDQLPPEQKVKDHLFIAAVRTAALILEDEE